MRHIDLNILLTSDDGKEVNKRLREAHKRSAKMEPETRKAHIKRNGSRNWRGFKDLAVSIVGRKCWYTEVELFGAPLAVDHYRPVCDYWWLAYDAENYRIACPWANSPEHNPLHGCAGGKGDSFPLLPPGLRAKGKNKLRIERPVILDPCNAADCELLAFQADGRPVLNPAFERDTVARQRVEQSKILLNLDHPELNSKREQLRIATEDDVRAHEALPAGAPERTIIRNRIAARLAPTAPFSTAARFYLKLHRHLDWVEAILTGT